MNYLSKQEGKRREKQGSSPGLRSAPVVAKPTSPGRRATPPGLHPGLRAKLRFAVLLFAAEGGRKSEKRSNDESEKKEKAKAAASGFNA